MRRSVIDGPRSRRAAPRQGSRRHHVAHHGDRRLQRDQRLRPRHRGRVRGPQGQGRDLCQGAAAAEAAAAIFASNTSTLPINSLAEEFKDQGKFIGIHFFSPVEKMMLVEIILGKNTGDVALATALDYVRADRQDADRRQRLPRLLRQPLRAALHRRRPRDAARRRAAGDDREHRQDGGHAGRAAVAVRRSRARPRAQDHEGDRGRSRARTPSTRRRRS